MKNIKIGIMLPYLFPAQLPFYVVNQINNISNQYSNYDFCLFVDNITRPCTTPNCAVMFANEIWGFEGILISTNIDAAIASTAAVNRAKNLFYVWDLEWLRGRNSFVENMHAFRNPNLQLIARSESHKKAIENYCNRPVLAVIPDINLIDIGSLWKH